MPAAQLEKLCIPGTPGTLPGYPGTRVPRVGIPSPALTRSRGTTTSTRNQYHVTVTSGKKRTWIPGPSTKKKGTRVPVPGVPLVPG
eukprot:1520096-Rhodomonas_salina.1